MSYLPLRSHRRDHRAARDARRARSADTRHRLLLAALREFGARGFHATSTRRLAHAARANQASIRYHFGGKKQLYLAVAFLIAERNGAALRPLLTESRLACPDRANARKSLAAIMEAFAHDLLTLSDGGAAAAFIATELATPGAAFPTLHDGYIRELHEEVTRLLGRATGRYPRAPDAIIDAHALTGAVLGFVSARKTFLRRAHRSAHTPAHVDRIAAQIVRLTACMTDGRA